jgi:hypothetical protein
MSSRVEVSRREAIYEQAIENVYETIGSCLLTRDEVLAFRPPEGMYLHESDEWHGIDHAVRVFIIANTIAKFEEKLEHEKEVILYQKASEIDYIALGWAAVGHDSGRGPGVLEEEHGKKGAEQLEKFLKGKISDTSLEEAMFLTKWHVPNDDNTIMTPSLIYLKDGDSSDRLRAEGHMWSLDTKYLRTTSAHLLIPVAKEFIAESKRQIAIFPEDRFAATLEAGVKVGLVRE